MKDHWTVDDREERIPEAIYVDGLPVRHAFELRVGDDGQGEVWAYGSPQEPGPQIFYDEGVPFISVRRYEGHVEVDWGEHGAE